MSKLRSKLLSSTSHIAIVVAQKAHAEARAAQLRALGIDPATAVEHGWQRAG